MKMNLPKNLLLSETLSFQYVQASSQSFSSFSFLLTIGLSFPSKCKEKSLENEPEDLYL